MHLLDSGDYDRASALTDAVPHYLSAQAVIAGASPGRVWVDAHNAPGATFIDAPEGFHLIGDPSQEGFGRDVAELYANTLVPAGRAEGRRYSCLHYWPQEWGKPLKPAIDLPHANWDYQHFLVLRELRINWRDLVPEGFEMLSATAEVLGSGLRGAQAIDGWGFWSLDDFLKRGFALLLVHDGQIVCRCTADMVVQDKAEVGIWTHEDFRSRGFATATAAAAVELCLQRGISHIGWHCWSGNTASRRTAEKVGFEHVLDHHGLELWLGE